MEFTLGYVCSSPLSDHRGAGGRRPGLVFLEADRGRAEVVRPLRGLLETAFGGHRACLRGVQPGGLRRLFGRALPALRCGLAAGGPAPGAVSRTPGRLGAGRISRSPPHLWRTGFRPNCKDRSPGTSFGPGRFLGLPGARRPRKLRAEPQPGTDRGSDSGAGAVQCDSVAAPRWLASFGNASQAGNPTSEGARRARRAGFREPPSLSFPNRPPHPRGRQCRLR
jgi:hypothetical protein